MTMFPTGVILLLLAAILSASSAPIKLPRQDQKKRVLQPRNRAWRAAMQVSEYPRRNLGNCGFFAERWRQGGVHQGLGTTHSVEDVMTNQNNPSGQNNQSGQHNQQPKHQNQPQSGQQSGQQQRPPAQQE